MLKETSLKALDTFNDSINELNDREAICIAFSLIVNLIKLTSFCIFYYVQYSFSDLKLAKKPHFREKGSNKSLAINSGMDFFHTKYLQWCVNCPVLTRRKFIIKNHKNRCLIKIE